MVETNDVKERGAPKINSGECILGPKLPKVPTEELGNGLPDATDAGRARKAVEPVPASEANSAVQEARRSRLLELKQQQRQDDTSGRETNGADSNRIDNEAPEAEARLTMEDVQQRELMGFLGDLVERDRKRRYQLGLIKGFLEDPVAFGLQTDVVPTSSTRDEIARRKKDLEYRVRLLESMLEVYKGELELLGMAEGQCKDG